MSLNQIILFSSIVSLATLVLLMIQKKKPEKFGFPPWRLGSREPSLQHKPLITWPPLLSVLFLLALTLGAGFLFRPNPELPPSETQNQMQLVWVDPTLSAVLSRLQNKTDPQEMAKLISSKSIAQKWWGLELSWQDRFEWKWKELSNLSELEAFLGSQSQWVVPYARPFSSEQIQTLSEVLKKEAGQEKVLHLVTDGQSETAQSLLPFGESISKAVFHLTGEVRSYLGERKEIMPSRIQAAWSSEGQLNSNPSQDPSQDPSAWTFVASPGVPEQAKPGVAVETFEGGLSFISPLASSAFPLVTLCGNSLGGLTEIDPTSDLRSLLEFFRVPSRIQNCLDQSIAITGSRDKNDLWSYRRQSLWVVPLTEEVAGTLFLKSEFWYPQGFDPCCDFVVYTAPLSGPDSPVASRVPLQLDSGTAPIPISLTAEPPEGSLRIGSGQDQSDGFVPILSTTEGVKIAYKTLRARAFYLRTGLAMPSGELGRSSTWSQVWLSFLTESSRSSSPSLRRISPRDPSEWNGPWKSALDPKTLKAVADPLSTEQNLKVVAGLSLDSMTEKESQGSEEKGAAHEESASGSEGKSLETLLEIAPSERSRGMLSGPEMESFFGKQETRNQEQANTPPAWTSPWVRWGAFLAMISLVYFWFVETPNKGIKSVGLLLLTVATGAFSFFPDRAVAQGFSNPFFGIPGGSQLARRMGSTQLASVPNIPFRIGWCEGEVPQGVKTQFSKLREILASRGTIELPQELKPNGCSAGGSEIWWSTAAHRFSLEETSRHLQYGGLIVVEGSDKIPEDLLSLQNPQLGLKWERQQRRGPLYRSFYLLQSFDHCLGENTWVLNLRKKPNAVSPLVVVTNASFLGSQPDCMAGIADQKERSFVNLMYALLTSDYKEDQMQLPELLGRIRSLGLEP